MVEKIRRVLPYRQRAVRPLPQIFPNEPVAFWLVAASSSHPAEAIEIRGPIALSILIFLSRISSPKTRGPNAARASPEARCLLRLMGSRDAAIRVHGGCCHGEGGQSRWEVG